MLQKPCINSIPQNRTVYFPKWYGIEMLFIYRTLLAQRQIGEAERYNATEENEICDLCHYGVVV